MHLTLREEHDNRLRVKQGRNKRYSSKAAYFKSDVTLVQLSCIDLFFFFKLYEEMFLNVFKEHPKFIGGV